MNKIKIVNFVVIASVMAAVGAIFSVAVSYTNDQMAKKAAAQSTSPTQAVVEAEPKKEPFERTVVETETQPINYETKTVDDASMEYGKTAVRTNGSLGMKTYTYNVTYRDGKEISRELVKEEITKQPVAKVIAKGTKILWHCVDATSYDKNPYNDNRCTSSTGEIRYVSDSESRRLDPSYIPGKSGHPWYNSK